MENYIQFFHNHWQLSSAFIILCIFVLINELITNRNKPRSLSPEQTVDAMNNHHAVIFDIRDAKSFSEGHITGAIRISEQDIGASRVKKYQDKPVIVVCSRGVQAAATAKKMIAQQFNKTKFLHGGIEAWKQANLPLVKNK
jgi:rhodanese-related sulfurtransferase